MKETNVILGQLLVLCDHVLIVRLLRSNGTTAILSRTAKRNKYYIQSHFKQVLGAN